MIRLITAWLWRRRVQQSLAIEWADSIAVGIIRVTEHNQRAAKLRNG